MTMAAAASTRETRPDDREGSLGKITTRPSVAQDSTMMLELYASTSQDELDQLGWSLGHQRTFVIMQAQTEEWNRARLYPGMDRLTICVDDLQVGRLLVCLRRGVLHLVDISLLPRYRGLGIGTRLVREVIEEAGKARVPVTIKVLKDSISFRIADQLGFTASTDLGRYVELSLAPPLTALGLDARKDGFSGGGTHANRALADVPDRHASVDHRGNDHRSDRRVEGQPDERTDVQSHDEADEVDGAFLNMADHDEVADLARLTATLSHGLSAEIVEHAESHGVGDRYDPFS